MSLIKKLASDAALYGLSSILGRVLNYLLVPLYTSYHYGFSRAEFGEFTKLYAYVAFLNIIYTYGMETTFFRYAKKESFLPIYRLIMSYIILTTGVFTTFILIFAPAIAVFLEIPQHPDWVRWLAWILAIDTLVAIPFARLRLENKAFAFASIKIANILITIGLNVFFLVICAEIYRHNWLGLKPLITWFYTPNYGVGYVVLANLLANACFVPLLWGNFKDFRFRFHWEAYRPLLGYALPLIFLGLAGTINQMFDKLVLQYWLPSGFYAGVSSLEVLGIYAAAAKISIFMMLVVQAFKYAAEPFFFAQAEDKNAPALFARVMRYFVIAGVVIWLGVSMNLNILKLFFIPNTAYHAGIWVAPILLLANLFLGIYYNLTVWFKLADKTRYGMWISLLGAGINIIANYGLIPIWGYYGCAWASLLTYLIMSWLCYSLGNRHYPIPYQLGSAFLHIGLGASLILLSYFLAIEHWGISFIVNNSLLLGYVGFVVWSEKLKV
ncbi:MAG: polysaccharide biosynthesis C-terminal domain-containing protein [Microscillaceae bacterium]|jgi:O-antigen/teichoic acid export membrane protein|nr:polysaccharide biosynthesis C-terminal domain-containing protein [Microscillaceae bacterium]